MAWRLAFHKRRARCRLEVQSLYETRDRREILSCHGPETRGELDHERFIPRRLRSSNVTRQAVEQGRLQPALRMRQATGD